MIYEHLKRGLKVGTVGGLAYGLFVAFVGNDLIAFAETFEKGHSEAPTVSPTVTDLVSVSGGVVFGLLLGIAVFGIGYYFLEPAIPGTRDTKSYILGTGGFLTISGAPWLLLPPQPPGVSQALPTETRLLWYGIMMSTGAIAFGGALYAYNRLKQDYPTPIAIVGGLTLLILIPAVTLLAPTNTVSVPIPDGLASTFRAVIAAGQIGLWIVMASAHAWLIRRSDDSKTHTELTDDTVSSPTTT